MVTATSLAAVIALGMPSAYKTGAPNYELCANKSAEIAQVAIGPKIISDTRQYSIVKTDSFLSLLFILYGIESRWNDKAVSPVGARGLAQIMPAVGLELAAELGLLITADDLFDRKVSILLSSYLLNKLLTQYNGNAILALTAYNGGPSRADELRQLRPIPRETSAYIAKIMYLLGECV